LGDGQLLIDYVLKLLIRHIARHPPIIDKKGRRRANASAGGRLSGCFNIRSMSAVCQTLRESILIQPNIYRQINQAIEIQRHPLIFKKCMLIVEKTTLILSTPGSLGSQSFVWTAEVIGMDDVSYFSGLYILCVQQR
jgi:hypothetical protein